MRVGSSLPPSLLLRTLAAQREGQVRQATPPAKGPAPLASPRAALRTQPLLPGVRTHQPRLFALLRAHELRTAPRAFDLPAAQEAPAGTAETAPHKAEAAPPVSEPLVSEQLAARAIPPVEAPANQGQGHPLAVAADKEGVASDAAAAKVSAGSVEEPAEAPATLEPPATEESTTETAARRFTQDDINALLKEFGHSAETRGGPLQYDLDGDGVVGPSDLFTALANFDGQKTGAQAVLEGVQQLYGAVQGDERYNPAFDVDSDGFIGPSDLFSTLANFASLTNS